MEQNGVFKMQYIHADVTQEFNFFGQTDPFSLVEKYGSPLYVYNESILRSRMRQMKNLVRYENFQVYFSAKANSSLAILQIAHQEGLCVDAMSPGEIYAQLKAGFSPDEIFYCCNNVSKDEMSYAIEKGILVGVDSVSQLKLFGTICPGGRVAIRFNAGDGAGHHEKVVTAGKNTKFGVSPEYIDECKRILKEYDLSLVGVHQHIGSLFLDTESYIAGVQNLLAIAAQFDNLEFVDFGGGFGIPYQKLSKQQGLDLKELGEKLDVIFNDFSEKYGKKLSFHIEPGRFVPAESAVLLGGVYAVKMNLGKKYIGTDLGFNVLLRPALYDSHHDVEIYRSTDQKSSKSEVVSVVGNICESGDIIAKDRELPEIFEGDILGVLDAGGYGHVMSSNYNSRLRPAEVMIRENGDVSLIRERDTLEDIVRQQKLL